VTFLESGPISELLCVENNKTENKRFSTE